MIIILIIKNILINRYIKRVSKFFQEWLQNYKTFLNHIKIFKNHEKILCYFLITFQLQRISSKNKISTSSKKKKIIRNIPIIILYPNATCFQILSRITFQFPALIKPSNFIKRKIFPALTTSKNVVRKCISWIRAVNSMAHPAPR